MHNQQDMDPQATGCVVHYIYGAIAVIVFLLLAFVGVTCADQLGWL